MSSVSDLTAAARIRDVALDQLGRFGAGGVTVRAIAEAAGVSPGLVIHHFGSKAGLVDAVEDHLIERLTVHLEAVVTRGDVSGAMAAIVEMTDENALVTYLARSLAEGGPAGDSLFDRLYDLSVDFLDTAIAAGICRPVDDREARAVMLLVEDLGSLLLRHHIRRALGVDPWEPAGMERIAAVSLDVKTRALLDFPTGDVS